MKAKKTLQRIELILTSDETGINLEVEIGESAELMKKLEGVVGSDNIKKIKAVTQNNAIELGEFITKIFRENIEEGYYGEN